MAVVAIVLVVAAGAAAYWWWLAPENVEAVRVEKRDVVELVIATGRLRSRTHSKLGVDTGGVVERVAVEEGDRVDEGQVLVALRAEELQSRVQQAQAQLEAARQNYRQLRQGPTLAELSAARADVERAESSVDQAEQDYERAQRLVEAGVVTRANFEETQTKLNQARAEAKTARAKLDQLQPRSTQVRQAKARVDEARASLKTAQAQLDKTTIAAPFAGLVTAVDAEPGQSVSPGSPLLTLASMSDAEYYVETDEDNLDKLKVGQPAKVFYAARPNEEFGAKLRQIGPEIDTDRGVVGVHLAPDKLPDTAFPGLTVDVNIEVGRFEDTPAVPVTSLLREDGEAAVLVVDDGHARRQEVQVRASGRDYAAVSGIEQGTVVVQKATAVEPGARVDADVGASQGANDGEGGRR